MWEEFEDGGGLGEKEFGVWEDGGVEVFEFWWVGMFELKVLVFFFFFL